MAPLNFQLLAYPARVPSKLTQVPVTPILITGIQFPETRSNFRAAIQTYIQLILLYPYSVPGMGHYMSDVWTVSSSNIMGKLQSYWTHRQLEIAVIVRS